MLDERTTVLRTGKRDCLFAVVLEGSRDKLESVKWRREIFDRKMMARSHEEVSESIIDTDIIEKGLVAW